MWLFLSDVFVSIVAPEIGRGVDPSKFLIVRARVGGDIERLFPRVEVTEDNSRDYRFRAVVPRKAVAEKLALEVFGLDYTNFKDTVKTKRRHDAYMRVWATMLALQREPLADTPSSIYGEKPTRKRTKPKMVVEPPSRKLRYDYQEGVFWDWQNNVWATRN